MDLRDFGGAAQHLTPLTTVGFLDLCLTDAKRVGVRGGATAQLPDAVVGAQVPSIASRL